MPGFPIKQMQAVLMELHILQGELGMWPPKTEKRVGLQDEVAWFGRTADRRGTSASPLLAGGAADAVRPGRAPHRGRPGVV
jgi:hypothetical protein